MIQQFQILRMLKVMNDIGNESSENVVKLKEAFDIGYVHQVVHPLQGIHNVCLVMVGIVIEVTVCNL